MQRGLVKPKWIRYEESWIGLTILLLVHICFYENQTRAWLILAFISRWHSSKVHNIEEMILSMHAQYDVTQEWLDRVKIARKGLRGTKQRWRPSDGLWTKVPWLRWRRGYLHWVDELISYDRLYYVDASVRWLEAMIWTQIWWNGSSHRLDLCLLQKVR
jgi:hypothetical protein